MVLWRNTPQAEIAKPNHPQIMHFNPLYVNMCNSSSLIPFWTYNLETRFLAGLLLTVPIENEPPQRRTSRARTES